MAKLLVTLWFALTSLGGPGFCCCNLSALGICLTADSFRVESGLLASDHPESSKPLDAVCCCCKVSDLSTGAVTESGDFSQSSSDGPSEKSHCPCKAGKCVTDTPTFLFQETTNLSWHDWAVKSDTQIAHAWFATDLCLSQSGCSIRPSCFYPSIGRSLLGWFQTYQC